MVLDLPDRVRLLDRTVTLFGHTAQLSLTVPFIGAIPLRGSSASPCEVCEGTGTIEESRPRRLDELYDKQIQVLFESDLYREGMDEETQKQLKQAQSRTHHQPQLQARF